MKEELAFESNISGRLKGAGALFASAFIYSTFGILIRQMAQMFGDASQTAIRFGVAFVFVLLINFLRKQPISLPRDILIKACLLGITFGCVVLLFTISINNTKIANTVFLLYAGSLITSLLIGTILLKENLTTTKIVAICIALLGIYMYSDAIVVLSIGVITGIASGIFDGISNAIRKTLKGFSRNTILTYQFAFSSLFAATILAFSGEVILKEVVPLSIVAVVIFALLQIGLGNFLLYGFQHFDVNVGTVILATELLFATILGFLFFREVPTFREMSGGTLIFIASVLSTIDWQVLFKKFAKA